MMSDPATEALAEAWASIDGKLDGFLEGKACTSDLEEMIDVGGYYSGYIFEAEEMVRRLNKRGFALTATIPHEGKVS